MIKANAHKYSVSAMCRLLQVNRSSYYYEAKQKPDESGLVSDMVGIFKASRNNYGTRKIKKKLMEKTPDRENHETGGTGIELHNCTIQTTKRQLQ